MLRCLASALVGSLLIGAPRLAAENVPPAAVPAAGSSEATDYAALKVRVDRLDDAEDKAGSPAGELSAHDAGSKAADQALLDFLRQYPATSHRWEVVQWYVEHRPYFFRELPPDPALPEAELLAHAPIDAAAAAAWRQTADGLMAAMDQAPGVPDEIRLATRQAYLEGDLADATNAAYRGERVDVAALGQQVRTHIAQFATNNQVRVAAYAYISFLRVARPAEVDLAWQEFAHSPNPRVREVAASQVKWAQTKQAPIALTFVAADGQPVDLARLRGKIVLLDFWATWCPPCRAEVPNVVAVYQRYHAQGFEIVGVALEHTPDPAKLLAFTKSHGMTWAQLDGGKTFQSEAAAAFGIYSIPHTVLLDRTGRVVAEDLRGPALERAVREQLGR